MSFKQALFEKIYFCFLSQPTYNSIFFSIFVNMKLRFCISYRAAFGQALHVVIRYIDVDGRMRDFNLPMYTDDGDVWMAESSYALPALSLSGGGW